MQSEDDSIYRTSTSKFQLQDFGTLRFRTISENKGKVGKVIMSNYILFISDICLIDMW